MKREVFSVKDDAKVVYCVSSLKWNGGALSPALEFSWENPIWEKRLWLRYVTAGNHELVHVVKINRLQDDWKLAGVYHASAILTSTLNW